MVPELKLAELLCTRLCHDLTGPIGAVANGAEFLGEEGFDLQNQAIDLIGSSAQQAVARLQFYRKAYGRINEDGEADLAEKKKTVEDFFSGSKITLDWPDVHADASGISISGKMGRLLLNMAIIASSSLLRGGTIAIRTDFHDHTKEIRVSAHGTSIKWDKDTEEVLAGRVDLVSLTPRTVQLYLTCQLAQEIGARLSWIISESSAEFTLCQAAQDKSLPTTNL